MLFDRPSQLPLDDILDSGVERQAQVIAALRAITS